MKKSESIRLLRATQVRAAQVSNSLTCSHLLVLTYLFSLTQGGSQ
jgi:hypothetical protein